MTERERGRGARDGRGVRVDDARAKSITPLGRVANDNEPAVTLTRGELALLMAAAVREAIAALPDRDGTPRLVDKQGLAALLQCSPSHIDLLRKRGLPTVPVGQAVRFEPERVIAWLRMQPTPQNPTAND